MLNKFAQYTASFLCILPILCFAQKVPVKVLYTGNDSVGKLLAYEFREGIRGSNGMRLVENDYPTPHIKVNLVSRDPGEKTDIAGASTAVSIAISYDSLAMPLHGAFITSIIQTCGSERVAECARRLLPYVDEAIGNLHATNRDLWDGLFKNQK